MRNVMRKLCVRIDNFFIDIWSFKKKHFMLLCIMYVLCFQNYSSILISLPVQQSSGLSVTNNAATISILTPITEIENTKKILN